jgi:CheY-like chemotaxis protein
MEANNKYRIVVHSFDKDEDRLFIKTLTDHFTQVHCVSSSKEITKILLEKLPTIVMVSSPNFQDTISVYYQSLGELEPEDCAEHFVVSLINRHDELLAFEAFKAGIIDDFLVSRPLYEIHRPALICHHLLKELGVTILQPKSLDFVYKNDSYDKEVRKVVASGVEKKEKLCDFIELSIKNISEELDKAEIELRTKKVTSVDLVELKDILSNIKSNHIRPELIKLQDKALGLLGNFIVAPIKEEVEDTTESEPKVHLKVDTAALHKNIIPKLLLVEDDPISLHCSKLLLDQLKVVVQSAQTGRRALAYLSSTKFDIIFLDLNLPDTNGLYILDQLKRSEGINKDTPIVLLTGNKNKNIVQQAIQMGAEGYIVKPLYKDVLFKQFKKFEIPLYKK